MNINLRGGNTRNLSIDDRGRLRLARADGVYRAHGEFLSDVYAIDSDSHWRLKWITQWTAPQVYRKSPSNPIYGPSQSGDWDSWTNGVAIVPFDGGTRYRMYYSGAEGEGIGFAEAQIDDPLKWTEHPASPVLLPRADNWEGNKINQPRVVKVTEDHWRMYYSGWGFPGQGTHWAMGLAESFDGGVTWERGSEDPVLERGGQDSADGAGVFVPTLIQAQGQWWMWYTAARANPKGYQNIHLCLATSADGAVWKKYPGNPVLTDDFSDGAPRSVTSRCCVRYDDGVFRMWYSFAKPDYRIHYAESLDGISWERSPISPVLGPSPKPAWDDTMVEYPEVQIVDGIFRLWFCGNGFGSVGYAEGYPQSGVLLSIRTGDSPVPDNSWSDWQRVNRAQVFASRRHVQVRAELSTEHAAISPALNEVHLVDS